MAEQTISVSLPTSTLYVSGTVNDVAYVWTNTEGDVWETTAARSDDEVYRVALTAINAQGVATEFEFALYYGILNLITDRTQADVDTVRALIRKGWASMTGDEQTQYLTALKGAYNAEDLNRVESAVRYVADMVVSFPEELRDYAAGKDVGWSVLFDFPYNEDDYKGIETFSGWTMSDYPNESSMERYLGNVVLLKTAMDADYPTLPQTMSGLTFEGANAIEKVLVMLHDLLLKRREEAEILIDKTAAAWFFSGDLYSGED